MKNLALVAVGSYKEILVNNIELIEKLDNKISSVFILTDDIEFLQQHTKSTKHTYFFNEYTRKEFNYFDKITQSKKRIATKPISIQIKSEKGVQKLIKKIDKKPSNINDNAPTNNLKYYYLLLGIAIGTFISILFVVLKNKQPSKDRSLVNQIKLARGDKALFDLLLPLNMLSLETVLQQLEANIYKNAQHKIRKKDIINAIKFEHKIN